jgi:hypothetical protein
MQPLFNASTPEESLAHFYNNGGVGALDYFKRNFSAGLDYGTPHVIERGFREATIKAHLGAEAAYAPLSEAEWKQGPYFRQGMVWSPDLNRASAQVNAEMHDARRVRDIMLGQYTGPGQIALALSGQFVAGAMDPLNFVPIVGEMGAWVRGAKTGLGMAARAGAFGAAENVAQAAVIAPVLSDVMRREGDEYGMAEAMQDFAAAAALGGTIGGVRGAFHYHHGIRAEQAAKALQSLLDAMAQLHEKDVFDVDLGGNAAMAQAADLSTRVAQEMSAGVEREMVEVAGGSPEAQEAVRRILREPGDPSVGIIPETTRQMAQGLFGRVKSLFGAGEKQGDRITHADAIVRKNVEEAMGRVEKRAADAALSDVSGRIDKAEEGLAGLAQAVARKAQESLDRHDAVMSRLAEIEAMISKGDRPAKQDFREIMSALKDLQGRVEELASEARRASRAEPIIPEAKAPEIQPASVAHPVAKQVVDAVVPEELREAAHAVVDENLGPKVVAAEPTVDPTMKAEAVKLMQSDLLATEEAAKAMGKSAVDTIAIIKQIAMAVRDSDTPKFAEAYSLAQDVLDRLPKDVRLVKTKDGTWALASVKINKQGNMVFDVPGRKPGSYDAATAMNPDRTRARLAADLHRGVLTRNGLAAMLRSAIFNRDAADYVKDFQAKVGKYQGYVLAERADSVMLVHRDLVDAANERGLGILHTYEMTKDVIRDLYGRGLLPSDPLKLWDTWKDVNGELVTGAWRSAWEKFASDFSAESRNELLGVVRKFAGKDAADAVDAVISEAKKYEADADISLSEDRIAGAYAAVRKAHSKVLADVVAAHSDAWVPAEAARAFLAHTEIEELGFAGRLTKTELESMKALEAEMQANPELAKKVFAIRDAALKDYEAAYEHVLASDSAREFNGSRDVIVNAARTAMERDVIRALNAVAERKRIEIIAGPTSEDIAIYNERDLDMLSYLGRRAFEEKRIDEGNIKRADRLKKEGDRDLLELAAGRASEARRGDLGMLAAFDEQNTFRDYEFIEGGGESHFWIDKGYKPNHLSPFDTETLARISEYWEREELRIQEKLSAATDNVEKGRLAAMLIKARSGVDAVSREMAQRGKTSAPRVGIETVKTESGLMVNRLANRAEDFNAAKSKAEAAVKKAGAPHAAERAEVERVKAVQEYLDYMEQGIDPLYGKEDTPPMDFMALSRARAFFDVARQGGENISKIGEIC